LFEALGAGEQRGRSRFRCPAVRCGDGSHSLVSSHARAFPHGIPTHESRPAAS
jgi:hypothetical protein